MPAPDTNELRAKTKQQERGDFGTQTRVFWRGPYMLCGYSHKVGKVDTKTLVVGQDVYMFSGCYVNIGKVVKVRSEERRVGKEC